MNDLPGRGDVNPYGIPPRDPGADGPDDLEALRTSHAELDAAARAIEAGMRARGDHYKDDDGIWRPLTAKLAEERGYALNGAMFLLDQDPEVVPVWGAKGTGHVLWAKGEPFYIFAAPGVGKSTLVQRLALARAGVLEGDVLGWPVAQDARKVLYLALDRPKQIARSWRRMVRPSQRKALEISLLIWQRPPPFLVSRDPDKLVPWIKGLGEVGTVIVDSFFNFAPSLSEEDGAANANNAFQALVSEGIELVVLHHDRKRDANGRKRINMDDMYGGRPISGGAGAILYLDGEPNTGKFECHWLKAPEGPVKSINAAIDFARGALEEVPTYAWD